MDQYLRPRHDRFMDPLNRPVEQDREVLVIRVLQVVRAIDEFAWEVIIADVTSHIQDVRDAVTAQGGKISCDIVTRDEQRLLDNLGTLAAATAQEPASRYRRRLFIRIATQWYRLHRVTHRSRH